jgi:osmotically-inducible protein OsmY
MRPRSIITAVVTVLIIAGAVYYFYGYRHRDISSDFNSATDYAEDAGTTAAVKSALALNIYNGAVRLTGSVQTSTQKADAESATRAITNVRDVDSNALAVTNSGAGQP